VKDGGKGEVGGTRPWQKEDEGRVERNFPKAWKRKRAERPTGVPTRGRSVGGKVTTSTKRRATKPVLLGRGEKTIALKKRYKTVQVGGPWIKKGPSL